MTMERMFMLTSSSRRYSIITLFKTLTTQKPIQNPPYHLQSRLLPSSGVYQHLQRQALWNTCKSNNNCCYFSNSSFAPTNDDKEDLISSINEQLQFEDEISEEVETDGWEEEEDEAEPEVGDGGGGGGVVLQGVPWGERALSVAKEVLLGFDDDMKLFAFKTTPRGYIYVRLDKLSNVYGCPSMEELESYSKQYKTKLDDVGALGEIPDDLALEVSSPGAERLLKVPDDLSRFKDMPMKVCYIEDGDSTKEEKTGVFYLESIETESQNCIWKLADVKDNRDPESKGRPLSRKRRDWRLKLPFDIHKKVTLYLEF